MTNKRLVATILLVLGVALLAALMLVAPWGEEEAVTRNAAIPILGFDNQEEPGFTERDLAKLEDKIHKLAGEVAAISSAQDEVGDQLAALSEAGNGDGEGGISPQEIEQMQQQFSDLSTTLSDLNNQMLRIRFDLDEHTRVRGWQPNTWEEGLTERGCMMRGLGYLDCNNTSLQGIDLRGASLRNWTYNNDLSWADLRGADLTNANLRGVNLSFANLSGANFTDTDLTGATLTGVYGTDIIGYSP